MKKRLRTLKVGSDEYLYSTEGIGTGDISKIAEGGDKSIFVIRIFKDKYSKYALLVFFCVLDDYYVGNPLNSGVSLYNDLLRKEVRVNLNRPLFVRMALDYGLEQGWNPTDAPLELDGLALLV
ncbi:hypothetical protein HX052_01760 [Myroides marinus]|uniref:hypothetical protein n=1 Tax=Myroides marinus TaxID=703342 RepID=UPI002575D2FE|nr:hypothetical protein [Myroides marinus]MDM1388702.1 hypothetical protein [Myroides marinus]